MQDKSDAYHWLVIARSINEDIRIGDDVVVRVERIAGDKVWLAVEAPNTMPVHRREVLEAIRSNNRWEEL